jgi:hypothetical protein
MNKYPARAHIVSRGFQFEVEGVAAVVRLVIGLTIILPWIVGAGCAARRHASGVAGEPSTTATFAPAGLPRPRDQRLSVEESRAGLHRDITDEADPHDALLALARIGDASSVPFLIRTLAKQGSVPREGPYGTTDTRGHCLDALQVITNQHAGRNAEDWLGWYERNKEKSQHEWILDGFAQHRFPVAQPIDEPFATALIRASDPKYQPDYVRTNALRILESLSIEAVARPVRALAKSSEPGDRRAAVAALAP